MAQPIQDSAALSFDVLIAGGGWVGLSLALMLPSQWRIAIVEATDLKQVTHKIDDRTLVLSQGTQRILNTLQLWPLLQNSVTPIQQVHVSSSGHFAACRLIAEEFGFAALGYTLPAASLTQALHSAVQQRHNITWYSPAQVSQLTVSGDHAVITLQLGEKQQIVNASLVAVADGAQSKIRQMLEISVKTHHYEQIALVANVELARTHQNRSLERFLSSGPLAMLPRSENTSALVWCMPEQQANQMQQWDDSTFLQALQQAVGYRLGRLTRITPRSTFPVHCVVAQQLVKPRIVLIGSAACHLHPIAAQSLNLAFRDVAILAELLTKAGQQGQSPGDWQQLKAYEKGRAAEHTRVTGVTNGAVELFSQQRAVLQAMGALSLLALDTVPFAKQQLVRQAVGFGSQPSKLMSGIAL
jgi:2-octaprenyl-6-methoxyphenol hydroxylase